MFDRYEHILSQLLTLDPSKNPDLGFSKQNRVKVIAACFSYIGVNYTQWPITGKKTVAFLLKTLFYPYMK